MHLNIIVPLGFEADSVILLNFPILAAEEPAEFSVHVTVTWKYRWREELSYGPTAGIDQSDWYVNVNKVCVISESPRVVAYQNHYNGK